MRHNYSHHHKPSNIKVAFFLNLSFTVVEIIGGILTGSVAIIADAIHDLGDSFSLSLSWFLEKYSKKGRTDKFSFGYKRFSLLAALINAIILIIGSVFVLVQAVPRLFNPQAINSRGMLILAIFGILVNGFAVLRLRYGKTLNEKAISWHLLEDVFGWFAVLIIALINSFKEVPILDPLLAIVFTLFIVFNVVKIIKKTLMIFLQSTPSNISISEVEKKIKSISGVLSIHDTHIWAMDDDYYILTTHLIVKDEIFLEKINEIKCDAKKIAGSFGVGHSTIEIDGENEVCKYVNCVNC